MYIHLGMDVVVKIKDIVGFFDIDNTSIGKDTREFLAKSEKDKNVINVCTDIPKSFVVVESKKERKVYITQISPQTIRKRNMFPQAENGGKYDRQIKPK